MDNLKNALNICGVVEKDTVFFGDAMADWEASDKMGVQFVGVGNSIKDLLKENRKDSYFIENFEIFHEQ